MLKYVLLNNYLQERYIGLFGSVPSYSDNSFSVKTFSFLYFSKIINMNG